MYSFTVKINHDKPLQMGDPQFSDKALQISLLSVGLQSNLARAGKIIYGGL